MGITFVRQVSVGALNDWDLEPTFALESTALLIRFSQAMLEAQPPPVEVRLSGIALKKGLGHRPGDLDIIHFAADGSDTKKIMTALSKGDPVRLDIITADKKYTVPVHTSHFGVAAAMMDVCVNKMSHNKAFHSDGSRAARETRR